MAGLPSRTDLAAERARRSLAEFVRQAWPIVEPGAPFVGGFHIDAICEHLEAVTRGDITRLVINLPPRHGKSLLVSSLWLPWAWATAPQLRWLTTSHAEGLAVRDSVRSRRLIESAWYQRHWGRVYQLTGDVNLKARYDNTRAGARIATGVGGVATGEGGDIITVDDAHKIEEGQSKLAREAVLEWFDLVLSTRLNDLRSGRIVVVGQRLHERDLSGHLLSRGGWTRLCLAAEYDPSHPFLWPDDPRTEPGQLLWPRRYGYAELIQLKRTMGSYATAGQLQQLPAPAGGGIFRREWFRWYDPNKPLPHFEQILSSWDLAYGTTGNYVVGQAWGRVGTQKYLLKQVRGRLRFTDSITAIQQLSQWIAAQFPYMPAPAVLIEKTANGAAAIDLLKRTINSIIPITPKGDKTTRAQAITPQIEAGNVYLPGAPNAKNTNHDRTHTPPWVQTFLDEIAGFPAAAHDDQVDAMTQALNKLSRRGPRVRAV